MLFARVGTSRTFRSLAIPNYRRWFIGQGLSVCGTWMDKIAQGWLILSLTHNSGVAIGAVVAVQFIPTLLFGAWGGLIADRFDKRKVMAAVSVAELLTASALAVLTLTGVIEVWMVFVLAFVGGCALAVDNPTRASFASEMVDDAHLLNAISLNSTLLHGSRIVGPALAGLVILTAGTGWCFALNALSFVALLVALARMDPALLHRSIPVARAKGQLRDGLRYIRQTPALSRMLLFFVITGTLAINFPIILPLFAKITFDGNAGTYSIITVAMGIGSLVGALVLAHRGRSSIRLVFAAAVVFGTATCVAALAPSLPVFLPLVALVGMGFAGLMAAGNSVVQLTSDPQMRGRVMAVWTICVLGTTPIGGPFIGWLSSVTSPRIGMAVGGLTALVAGVVILGALVRSRPVTDRADAQGATLSVLPSATATAGATSAAKQSVAR